MMHAMPGGRVRLRIRLLNGWLFVAAAGSGPCVQDVRKQLLAMYDRQDRAIRASDFAAFAAILDSGYVVRLRNGRTLGRAEVERHVSNDMALTVAVRRTSTSIDSLWFTADSAVAVVTREADRTVKDDQGVPHSYESKVVHRETWVRRTGGWRIRSLEELEQVYLRRDGRADTN